MQACPSPCPVRMKKVALGHRPPEDLQMSSVHPFCLQGLTWSPRGPGGAGLPSAGGPVWGEASAGAPPCCVPCAALVAPWAGAQAGSSKVSLTGPCTLPAKITARAAKRWITNPGASSAPTPKGRGGAPSTATKAAPPPRRPATTPRSTKRGAFTASPAKGSGWPNQRANSPASGLVGAGAAGRAASGAGGKTENWRLTASVQASAEARASSHTATLSWRRPRSSPSECINPDSMGAMRMLQPSSPRPGAAGKRDRTDPPSQVHAPAWRAEGSARA
jgi:hypothetical protein